MLTITFPFLHPKNIQENLADTLLGLAADLDRVRRRQGPTKAELAEAPLLRDWRSAESPMGVRLVGSVHGHPRLGDRLVMTSPIWAADPGGDWVRTMSRFYRLGDPFRPTSNADDLDAYEFEGGL